MTPAVFLNGRFLSQPVSGVQRFSLEITAAIDRLVGCGEWPETVVLTPRPAEAGALGRTTAAYRRLQLREVGRRQGHLWEQADLPGAARGGVLLSLGNTAPMLAGQRQVVVIHDAGVFDTPESYSLRFRTWYKTLQHCLVRAGAQVVTVSKFSRDRIVARLGLDPARIVVMYEGADHILRVQADPDTLDRHSLRPRQYALVVSNRVAHKNLDALHEAAAALERRGMVIAVAGGSNADVFQGINGPGFAERRLGRVSDGELRTLYENAACLLFPSRYEGFGLPPVEAMACGCPVLAAGGNAVEEICGDSALYFTSDRKQSIVDAVERLLDEPGLADTLRARGHARSAALSWDASARTLGDAVRRVR
jgi:glycosyltransferase involved in cell wall biosynthesis